MNIEWCDATLKALSHMGASGSTSGTKNSAHKARKETPRVKKNLLPKKAIPKGRKP
jgi:hypothetical protein